MPQYLSPGVYVEEVPSGSAPIAGVSTSIAGFIGSVSANIVTPEQPGQVDSSGNPIHYPAAAAGAPMLITSWENYKKNFGDFQIGNRTLSHAVYGFFNNGGTRCWVTSVTEANFETAVTQATTAASEARTATTAAIDAADAAAPPVDATTAQTEAGNAVSAAQNAVAAAQAAVAAALTATQAASGTPPDPAAAASARSAEAATTDAENAANDADAALTAATTAEQFAAAAADAAAAARSAARAAANAATAASGALVTSSITAALTGFNAVDEITMVMVPGSNNPAVQDAVISHCENAGDRFAILDGQRSPSQLLPAMIQGSLRDSNYAALYYPWIEVYDPVSNANLIVPPSGHMAGIYARVDNERGVHKAPANEIIRGALNVERRLSKSDQDGLNPDGINIIRRFNGNITVWGARTLGGDANTEWKYISVRRLFLFLRESIDEGTQWVVFEPNTPDLWAKITRNITAFLTVVWRSGALFGGSPAEAFYVRCNSETNPPEVRDLGQVVTEIGVAPVKPAEFVIFRISQWAGPAAG